MTCVLQNLADFDEFLLNLGHHCKQKRIVSQAHNQGYIVDYCPMSVQKSGGQNSSQQKNHPTNPTGKRINFFTKGLAVFHVSWPLCLRIS